METRVVAASEPGALELAAELLGRGEIVALPSETVYGLAADALNPVAAAKIFEAKERPAFDPLICHLPDAAWLTRMTAPLPPADAQTVATLTKHFWPGPLTLVLPKSDLVPDLVTSGLPTVALRLSAHPVITRVAQALGRPLAAPSANRFGRISPTTAAHVLSELEGRVPLIIDAGPAAHGIESTIVAVEDGAVRILRAGPVTLEELAFHVRARTETDSTRIEAPGQLASHYAPRTPLRFATDEEPASPRVGLLAWKIAPEGFGQCEVLSPSGDLREAAATLFAKLRRLDEAGLDLIVAQAVPEHDLGVAIMDRLRRASFHEPHPFS